MRVLLARPRGYCAGVTRAIEAVESALRRHGPPVYVRHEIVHNRRVLEDLRAKGAVFVKELDEIPDGAVTVFSAHGVSQAVADAAVARGLPVIDATCPLVRKVHRRGIRHAQAGWTVVLIGHVGHPEVEGTLGRIPGPTRLVSSVEDVDALEVEDPERLAYATQTTLSLDDTREVILALTRRFPGIRGPDTRDICYATQNRQNAVRELAEFADLILVIGSPNSSNSNRLQEIGERAGVPSHLIDGAEDLDPDWLAGVQTVGVTAGASAPEVLVTELVERLVALGASEVETLDGVQEAVRFRAATEVRAEASVRPAAPLRDLEKNDRLASA